MIHSGNSRRKMARTQANEFSSRSHAIIQIQAKIPTKDGTINSKLSFVDLAGCERICKTGLSDLERINEGSNINKSLLALRKVILKLSENKEDNYLTNLKERSDYLDKYLNI